jgi:hypothetical protein
LDFPKPFLLGNVSISKNCQGDPAKAGRTRITFMQPAFDPDLWSGQADTVLDEEFPMTDYFYYKNFFF